MSMRPPSDHLLRTFAAIPIGQRVLDVGCGEGRHTLPLARLGFDVFACDSRTEQVETVRSRLAELVGRELAEERVTISSAQSLDYPDEHFDWVVAFGGHGESLTREEVGTALSEMRRVLRSGGWVYVALPARELNALAGTDPLSTDGLKQLMKQADLAEAERPKLIEEGQVYIRAIYRRVDG